MSYHLICNIDFQFDTEPRNVLNLFHSSIFNEFQQQMAIGKAMEEEKDDEDKDDDHEEDPGNGTCAGGKGKKNKR